MAEHLDSELKQTADEGKRLWTLVSRYARLEMVDKLTFILSGLLLGGILVGIAVVAVFCLSMFCVTLLQTWGVSQPFSYVLMAILLSGAAYAILRKKQTLVTRPVLQALLREFFPAEDTTESTDKAQGTAGTATPHFAETNEEYAGKNASVAEDANSATETSRPS